MQTPFTFKCWLTCPSFWRPQISSLASGLLQFLSLYQGREWICCALDVWIFFFSGTKWNEGHALVSEFRTTLTRTERHPSEDRRGQCQESGRHRSETASGFGIDVCRCSSSHQLKTTSQFCSLRSRKGLCYSAALSLRSPLTPLFLSQSCLRLQWKES